MSFSGVNLASVKSSLTFVKKGLASKGVTSELIVQKPPKFRTLIKSTDELKNVARENVKIENFVKKRKAWLRKFTIDSFFFGCSV